MKNRDRTEIIIKILETVYDHEGNGEKGITQSMIRYEVYLSGAQLRVYLIPLTLHELLVYDSAMRRYHITQKGTRFLDIWHNRGDIADELRQ
jgi:predicted transcriptional regulator